MASALDLFRVILRKLLFSTGAFFQHFFRRWALFFAFLGRRSGHVGVWRLWDDRKRGTFPKAEQAERSLPSTETSLDSAGYATVATSSVPASASCPNLENVSSVTVVRQPQRAASLAVTIPPSDRDIRNSQPTINGLHQSLSSNSGVVREVNPSRDSHSRGFFADQPPRTEEPHIISSPADHSSYVIDVALDASAREGSLVPQLEDNPTAPSSSSTSNITLPEGRFLALLNSELVSRYTREVTISGESVHNEIPPLTRIFPYNSYQTGPGQGSRLEDCAPWVPASHPDGSLYFFDQERRLFTDTDMFNPELRKEMGDFYILLQRILARRRVDIPSNNYDLTLDITPANDGRISWSYYYACLETRCLFWLHPCDTSNMTSKLVGDVRSPAHISASQTSSPICLFTNRMPEHRLEALYWTHWSLFPVNFNGRHLDRPTVDELMGILSYGYMDMITSGSKSESMTLPFDGDTMQKMLALVQNAKKSDAGLVYHTAGVARLLSIFTYWRFIYFHGQRGAGFGRHGTVQRKRTFLVTLVSPVLFNSPKAYLQELEGILVLDKAVGENRWRSFISGLLKEWEQLILPSTVLLSANIGFLAIPGVINSNSGSNDTTTNGAPIASYVSMVTSIGGIMIGLLLNCHSSPEQYNDSGAEGPQKEYHYFYWLHEGSHGIILREWLAIVFSLPWALLMWSLISFFFTVLQLLPFMGSKIKSSTPSPLDKAVVMVAFLVVYFSVLYFAKIPRRPDEATRGYLFGLLLVGITYMLEFTYNLLCDTIVALLHFNFTSLWESLSLATLDCISSVRSRPNREGTGPAV
ncbi:hypothetical protein V8E53_010429 [Lactarius tabidus]